jgi:hypothetical protein
MAARVQAAAWGSEKGLEERRCSRRRSRGVCRGHCKSKRRGLRKHRHARLKEDRESKGVWHASFCTGGVQIRLALVVLRILRWMAVENI